MMAREAGIRRIDAGPAAIALTPHDRTAAKPLDDLVEKNGRWIAAESIADPIVRAGRIEELLDALIG
jgi:transcription-repair coupling factor (superfamily II helicase)